MVGIVKPRLIPMGRRRVPGGLHEGLEIAIAHLEDCHLEAIHPNAVDGAFIVAAPVAAHQEVTGGDGRTDGIEI
jgi:hypothetical protein